MAHVFDPFIATNNSLTIVFNEIIKYGAWQRYSVNNSDIMKYETMLINYKYWQFEQLTQTVLIIMWLASPIWFKLQQWRIIISLFAMFKQLIKSKYE